MTNLQAQINQRFTYYPKKESVYFTISPFNMIIL